MKLYEIDREIESLLSDAIDPETGEVLFLPEKLEELQMEKERKTENLALAVKNLTAEGRAIREEEIALAERRKSLEKRAERAREYLEFILQGEKFRTAKVAVSWRSSKRVTVDEGFLAWAKRRGKRFLRMKDPEPDKTAIREALQSGEKVPHAAMVEETNMQIK